MGFYANLLHAQLAQTHAMQVTCDVLCCVVSGREPIRRDPMALEA